MSPEQVHLLPRKDLKPDKYVTSQQIRSLFSNWSAQKRLRNLKAPEDYANIVHSMAVLDDNNEIDRALQ